MEVLRRIGVILVLVWLLVAQVYIVALPLGFWYILRFKGYELIVIAILIDGYYQAFYTTPVLTLSTLFVVLLVDIIKPQLLVYTGDDEIVS
jgi:hypothetical protein